MNKKLDTGGGAGKGTEPAITLMHEQEWLERPCGRIIELLLSDEQWFSRQQIVEAINDRDCAYHTHLTNEWKYVVKMQLGGQHLKSKALKQYSKAAVVLICMKLIRSDAGQDFGGWITETIIKALNPAITAKFLVTRDPFTVSERAAQKVADKVAETVYEQILNFSAE